MKPRWHSVPTGMMVRREGPSLFVAWHGMVPDVVPSPIVGLIAHGERGLGELSLPEMDSAALGVTRLLGLPGGRS